MNIYVDCEGDPIQEFSAIYVDKVTCEIVDVFHEHVTIYPTKNGDVDWWARRHIHGLNRDFLSIHGLSSEQELLLRFRNWLQVHPYDTMFGHAPYKERKFLSLNIVDVQLPTWQHRASLSCHTLIMSMKRNNVPICGIDCCAAHTSYVGWRAKRPFALTPTDAAKKMFGHHCSLYDCVEMYFFHL